MKRLRILTLVAIVLTVIVYRMQQKKPSTLTNGEGLVVDVAWLKTNQNSIVPKKDIRSPDQTFLTYPEWFLVFSPAEQAYYFQNHTSTTFPYQTHVAQLWKGYEVIYDQIKGNYPFNTGYHVMIMVIAGSTTVEYGVKSTYETLIGRITDPANGAVLTDEDKFNATYERSYVDFIEKLPWYEYDFTSQLKKLWSNTSLSGPNIWRKLERKYYLTTELLVKSGYGWLIKKATKSAYDEASLETAVITDQQAKPIYLPRYAGFNIAASKLAVAGVNFKDIAGNNNAIMLTLLTRNPLKKNPAIKQIFTQPIVTNPGLNRIAIVTTVGELGNVIRNLTANQITIEHIYDY